MSHPSRGLVSALDWRFRKNLELELNVQPSALTRLEHQLEALAGLCEEVMNVEGSEGRPNKEHVDVAVLALARLWVAFSGKPFTKTYTLGRDPDRAGGKERFVSPGPRFVETILTVIAK